MRFLAKLVLIFLILGSAIFLKTTPANAIATFATDYEVTYDVDEQGITHVTFNIKQKNNLSTIYATSFSLSLSQTNLTNIIVRDAKGVIVPEVSRTDNVTNISFDFLNKVVGREEVNEFTISFDSTDIASKQGSIWEINIPKLEPNENTNNQIIILKVPESFGSPAYVDPRPSRTDGNVYQFSSSVLSNKSISAVFGTTQYFKVQLIYNLSNSVPKSMSTQIAIPPDTAYQTVFIKSLTPKPESIAIDPDGNWLATYLLTPSTDLQVTADLIIKLNFQAEPSTPPETSYYTRPTKVWDYEDPDVSVKSENLNSPKAIYDFVVNSLSYDYAKVTDSRAVKRPGAVYAINNPQSAICTEFTDLFIALARKKGIAARENQGYAISTNDKLKPLSLSKDILHAWPEFYDPVKKTWLQIDPTWGNTTGGIDYFNKLDLNHLVFVIHGLDPVNPLPAGSYKTAGGGSKDVFVAVTSPETFPNPNFKVKYDRQERDLLYFTISNSEGVAGEVLVDISGSHNIKSKSATLTIPPFSESTIEVDLSARPHFYPTRDKLIITLNGQETTLDITLEPNLPPILIGLVGVLVVILFAVVARSLYFRRRKQNSPLHW